jgi:hypothetical protein
LNLTFPLAHTDPPSARQLRCVTNLFREHGLPVDTDIVNSGPLTRRYEFAHRRKV